MERITRKDFRIVCYRHGGRLQGQENLYLYEIIGANPNYKVYGKVIADGFTSKRHAYEWLSPRIKAANLMRAGKLPAKFK